MSETATETAVVKQQDMAWWKVKLSHPTHHRKVVFRSLSEKRARAFVVNRFPRGSEAYLESPDGTTEHYEAERQGHQGTDVELWQPFDPDTWIPPDTQTPPGETMWADKEG